MTSQNAGKQEKLLTPSEVAGRFRVDPKTVTRWAKAGLLPCIKTPGGHRRYPAAVVDELAREHTENATENG
jgi:excisionase family DNA binding protein